MEQKGLSKLMSKISYKFKNNDLLEEALRHSSFVNEQIVTQLRDNECLEFLGDAVLNLVVGHILMNRFPDIKEGELSRMRACLVNESQLADLACVLGLGSYIKFGRGEIQTNGSKKKSILADTFEALIAAIYLDGGFSAAFKVIERNFLHLLNDKNKYVENHDYKSQLQEFIQTNHWEVPDYCVIDENGPDHDKTFVVQIKPCSITVSGVGKSKKMAEQDAARKALAILKKRSFAKNTIKKKIVNLKPNLN